ncbi:phosphotransferase family protein [Streptomyces sp. 4.24]|uniref:phosphotransferase family protein n=1 Tax=Streptomyces tritrimontium TaxID=3406573 RepID=UPI003BB7F29F
MAAAAVRPAWGSLHPDVRAHVERRLGARVARARSCEDGFTPGVASRLLLDDGRRAFLKGIHAAHPAAPQYADEIAVTTALPAGIGPGVRWSAAPEESGGWWWLCLEDVAGTHPVLAPGTADTRLAVDAVERAARRLTPSPAGGTRPVARVVGPWMTGWSALRTAPPAGLDPWARRHLDLLARIERDWWPASVGDTLLHWDLHPANMLRRPAGGHPERAGEVVIIDWSYRLHGAAWIDTAVLVPQLILGGHTADQAERALARLPRPSDDTAFTAFAAGLAGLWAASSRRPPPPGAPSLRHHQARLADASLSWLRHRTGLP